MMEFFKNKTTAFYLRLAVIVLSIIPIFYAANVGSPMKEVPKEYTGTIICLIVGILLSVLELFLDGNRYCGYVALATSAVLSLAFMFFLSGGLLSIIDYVHKIIMWGDATQFGSIVLNASVLFVGMSLSIATCWMK